MDSDRKLLIMAFSSLAILLIFGTFLFKFIEGWTTFDAFYFSGVTMLTIGYGDIAPHTHAGKIATIFFGMVSVGITLYALSIIARMAFRHSLEDRRWLRKK